MRTVLKTPLTTIRGYVQLGQSEVITPGEAFHKIDKQLGRLEGIIGDLLDISKIQAGKLDLEFQYCNLAGIIKESIESVQVTTHNIVADMLQEDITVMVDRGKIIQVIVNLLSNGIKYADGGTTVHVSSKVIGDQVEIIVTDQGIVIPAEHLKNIFNQYYRVATEARKAKGMDLGLFICKELIEAHGGSIQAESESGKGSSFHILFPVESRQSSWKQHNYKSQ